MVLFNDYLLSHFDPMSEDINTLPNSPGFYMIGIKNQEVINIWFEGATVVEIENTPIIYIGISRTQGLRNRFRNHLEGTARNSTLRKSLGSLFGWYADRVYDNGGDYRFTDNREKELNAWMSSNLIFLYHSLAKDEIDFETHLINEFDPPLNISKNYGTKNVVFRTRLSILRK